MVEFEEHTSEGKSKTLHEIENTHHSYLFLVKETEEDARASLLYSYKHSINGFAAFLTSKEANKLSGKTTSCNNNSLYIYLSINISIYLPIYDADIRKLVTEMEGVVSVQKSKQRIYSLHTTRSWQFVGLDDGPLDPLEEESNQRDRDLLIRAKYGENIIVGMIDNGKFSLHYCINYLCISIFESIF